MFDTFSVFGFLQTIHPRDI